MNPVFHSRARRAGVDPGRRRSPDYGRCWTTVWTVWPTACFTGWVPPETVDAGDGEPAPWVADDDAGVDGDEEEEPDVAPVTVLATP